MKNRWGWKDAWQQLRQVLHRWTQILSIAYAFPQLLATYCGEQVESLMDLTPWRKKDPTTAGRIQLELPNDSHVREQFYGELPAPLRKDGKECETLNSS